MRIKTFTSIPGITSLGLLTLGLRLACLPRHSRQTRPCFMFKAWLQPAPIATEPMAGRLKAPA